MPTLTLALVTALGLEAAGCRSVSEMAAPVFTLSDVDVRGFSGGVADLVLTLQIENLNDFEITLIALSGGLAIDGAEVGQVKWSGEIDCPKNSAAVARIPIHLAVTENQEIFSDLIDRRRPFRHGLRGESTFARGVIQRTYPVAVEGQLGESGDS
jgi:LEA14-like dessication related protein